MQKASSSYKDPTQIFYEPYYQRHQCRMEKRKSQITGHFSKQIPTPTHRQRKKNNKPNPGSPQPNISGLDLILALLFLRQWSAKRPLLLCLSDLLWEFWNIPQSSCLLLQWMVSLQYTTGSKRTVHDHRIKMHFLLFWTGKCFLW